MAEPASARLMEDADFLEAIDDILTTFEDRPDHVTAVAALVTLYILSHDRKLDKTGLLAFLTRRVNEDFEMFTRAKVQSAIDRSKKLRKRHPSYNSH